MSSAFSSANARSSAARSSAGPTATSASPYLRKAALFIRMCPRPQPNEIAGQPRMCASRIVSPPVEWISASAAAIQSPICSVNPSARTRR